MDGAKPMTIEEVADFLRVSVSTVYGLAQRRELVGVKVGREWRFTQQAVNEYLTKNTATEKVAA